jgi:hypothetical protein
VFACETQALALPKGDAQHGGSGVIRLCGERALVEDGTWGAEDSERISLRWMQRVKWSGALQYNYRTVLITRSQSLEREETEEGETVEGPSFYTFRERSLQDIILRPGQFFKC